MSTRLIFDKQETGLWIPETGPSIAPNVPKSYRPVAETDGTRFYIDGDLPYAGVCWKQVNDLRQALAYKTPFSVALQLHLKVDDAFLEQAEAAEVDVMYSDQNGNVGNCSGHLNVEKGGIWEIIDLTGNWIPVPQFPPTLPVPDTATPLTVKMTLDPAKEVSQITGIAFASTIMAIDGPVLPFLKLGWGPNQLVNQIQPGLRQAGGAFSMKVMGMCTTVAWP